MKINHKLLEVEKELNNDREVGAFIRGLCDEIVLYKMMLQYYIAATLANTRPDIFYGLRLSIEGSILEWIWTGKPVEKILANRQKEYEKLLKRMGVIKDENIMDVA